MRKTDTTLPLRFLQPLRFNPPAPHRAEITGPFPQRPRRAGHDMLLLNTHPEFLPAPELAPPRDLTFFNLDRP